MKERPGGRPLSARDIAARVVTRVVRDRAYAALALESALKETTQIDPRDAALATELSYGVLRTYATLERLLMKHAAKKKSLGQPEAQSHLLVGAYQLLFLDRVPAHAAVNEAVSAVRRLMGDPPSKYANALLRKVSADPERPTLNEATVESTPAWLRSALVKSLGETDVDAYLTGGNAVGPPPLGLSLRAGVDREVVLSRLREAMPHATFTAGRLSPRAILCSRAANPRLLPGFDESFIVQEEGAQVLALLLGAEPGERVLDACAGRGNKTFVLSGEVSPNGHVHASDLHPNKAKEAGRWAKATSAVDWTVGVGDVPAGFDRVLVDAPCSGVGTLRRRPEIALHRRPNDLQELTEMQANILAKAASRVRAGGHLLYAVCSVLEEEAEAIVARGMALAQSAGITLEPAPFSLRHPEVAPELSTLVEGKTTVRLLPHVHGTDGYFAARLRARA